MRTFFLLPLLFSGIAFGQTPESNQDRARALLDASLKDKNPETRTHAVQSLGLVSTTEPWLSELETMLADKDVEVRLAAIASLLDLKSDGTIPALRKALDSNVPEVSFAAAKALWKLGDPSGREALFSVLDRETKEFLRIHQQGEARRAPDAAYPEDIFRICHGREREFHSSPGRGRGRFVDQGILSAPGVSGGAAAALLLSTDHSPEVLRALQDALSDKDWSVRAAAVHAIAVRNDPTLQASLIPLFEDKKEAVRVRAAAGYLRLEAIKSAPVLTTEEHR